MKNLLLLLFALMSVSLSAQVKNIPITADTVKGAETVYFEPDYSIGFSGVNDAVGTIAFYFTKTDVRDSCSAIKLQQSADGTNYVNMTGTYEKLTATTTDGNYVLYVTSPNAVKYRLAATCISGDTVRFSNVRFVYLY